MGIPDRFLTDSETKYAMKKLELLGALWEFKRFRYYVYGKK